MRHTVVNFYHMMFFNVHTMRAKRKFLHFAPLEMWSSKPGFNPASSSLGAPATVGENFTVETMTSMMCV